MAEMMIELVQELNRAFSARGCEFHRTWGDAPGSE
jgi:hypothetical protein